VGRIYETTRLARFGDLSPGGRLRLDAVGRYLQDVSGDDTADLGYDDLSPWVVRRLTIETHADATFRERLALRTWCSGTGGHWAERRVSIEGSRGACIEAAALWVHIDTESGAPRRLTDDFFANYGDAAAGRRVSARLRHEVLVPSEADRRSWPTRFVDFDPLRHVNNAVYLAAVEEERARRAPLSTARRVEVEYRAPVEGETQQVVAAHDRSDGAVAVWLLDGTTGLVFAHAGVRPSV
jgi:acyl-ACP thioesterase